MNNNEDDKTRIAKPAAEENNPFGPASSTSASNETAPNASAADDDKTRIATPKVAADDDDKTRIATTPNVETSTGTESAQPASDVTQIKPLDMQSYEDKTRVAPAKSKVDTTVPDPLTDHSIQSTDQSQQTILKNRFVLEKVLGAGGMGVVYKAKDLLKVEAKDRDPYVAIKVLSEEFKTHPEAFISLQRESRKSQRIAHPNIVNVFDFDRDDDTVFMTMEYMDGKPLDKLIRQYNSTGLPTDDAFSIIEGMCAALNYAHTQHIVHSDFKPGNVFVTNAGIAKVFDFGIARAVSKVEHSEISGEDKTQFDAGNLGALTPAYASLEMLEGETPDVRDDIYALGCVAYEVFTGEHPFNKLPANQAAAKKLKPKRINSISKRQWSAIEKALAFHREDRIESVEDFIHLLTVSYKPTYKIATALALLLSLSITVYFVYFKTNENRFSEKDIRNELEYSIRLDLIQKNILRLINDASFDNSWQEEIWSEFQQVSEMLPEKDPWLAQHSEKIYNLYIGKIATEKSRKRYTRALNLTENALRYSEEKSILDKEKAWLADAIKKAKSNQRVADRQQRQAVQTAKASSKKKVELFDVAMDNVQQQLQCQSRLNMRNLDTAIKKLKSLDKSRYQKQQAAIINSLAACIAEQGKSQPERAIEAKKYAMRMFGSNRTIAATKIIPRDPCDESIAGLGARGKRTLCRDKIQNYGMGPEMIVVPASKSQKMYAISKYEISISDLNVFCKRSDLCQENKSSDSSLPATNVPIKVVKGYLKWLSKKTTKKYRLPTKTEWHYASKSRRVSLDPNRNCKLSTRGIQKGDELVKTTTGKQNSWGLVNYIGNAQEWVYDKGRTLIVVGGSYKDAMESCNLSTNRKHNGGADNATGFRVLRELKRS